MKQNDVGERMSIAIKAITGTNIPHRCFQTLNATRND